MYWRCREAKSISLVWEVYAGQINKPGFLVWGIGSQINQPGFLVWEIKGGQINKPGFSDMIGVGRPD